MNTLLEINFRALTFMFAATAAGISPAVGWLWWAKAAVCIVAGSAWVVADRCAQANRLQKEGSNG